MSNDASHRAECGQKSNPLCPDFSAHWENALDRLFPDADHLVTIDESEVLDREAEAEYMNCEGH